MKKVLTVKDVAQMLGVCDKTAYRLVNQAQITKEFKVIKLGRVFRIPIEPFLNWMDNQ